jgi:hypothetical protein
MEIEQWRLVLKRSEKLTSTGALFTSVKPQAQGRHTILSMKRGIGDDLSNFESLWSGWAEVEINQPEVVLFVDEAEAMPRRGISSQLLQWTM